MQLFIRVYTSNNIKLPLERRVLGAGIPKTQQPQRRLLRPLWQALH